MGEPLAHSERGCKIVNSLGKLNLDEDKKVAGLYGEASFIRGGLMMELAMLYGRIPIIDVSRQDELGYGRQPLKDVWQFIINDLKNAAQYCPETNNPGRATRYAASMMLGYATWQHPRRQACATSAWQRMRSRPL